MLIQIDIAPALDMLIQIDTDVPLAEYLSHKHKLRDGLLGQDLEKRIPKRAIRTAILDNF
jgi:hypothetical protein